MNSDRLGEALALFERAVALPRDEQDSFVATACGDNADLRDRVLAMLRADADDAPLLDATPNELASALSTGPPPALEGQRIGPYVITAMLGRGGMGIVYLAKRDDVQKLVALKIVAGGLASPDRVARFVQERRVLAQLEHPHIARLLDAGVTEDGTPWFAMDYVPGKPIDVYCDERRLSIMQRLALFENVCRAVAYAHRHLVVHRDLKPSNILVTADSEPRLVDFGIAKMLDESGQVIESLTASHSLPLTPQYASPEQIRGDAITTASDIYQLGALLFELLTGRPPHPERYGRLGASAEVAISRPSSIASRERQQEPKGDKAPMTAGEIAAARSTTPERLRRSLAGDLDTIVAKATQLEPARRYATTEQLADDVRRHRQGLPVLARPTSTTYRVGRFVRRHKAGSVVVAIAFVSLLGFSVAMAQQARRIEAQRVRAEEVSTLLSDLFAGADPTVTQGDSVTVASLLQRGAERVRAGLTSDPEVKARLLAVIARAYDNLGRYSLAVELQSEVVQLLRSNQARDHPDLLHAVSRLGSSLALSAEYERAKSLMQEFVPVARTLPSGRRADLAMVLTADGLVRQLSNDPTGARAVYEEALAIYRTLPDTFGVLPEETLVNLGFVSERRGDARSAEQYWREALERRRKRLGPSHSLTAKSMLDLSNALVVLNKLDEAEQLVREAVAVQKKVFRAPHADVSDGLFVMARLLSARGKNAEAEATQRQAMPIMRQLWGDSSQAVALGTANLAGYVQGQGRLDEAAVLHREALRLYSAVEGELHPSTAIVMTNLARTLYLSGQLAESESIYRRAITILDSVWQGSARLSQTLTDFAQVLRDRGKASEGETNARRALQLRTRDGPPELTLYPQRILGTCLVRLGRYAEAESLLVDVHGKLVKGRGPDHDLTKATARDLTELYKVWGKLDKARQYRTDAPMPLPK